MYLHKEQIFTPLADDDNFTVHWEELMWTNPEPEASVNPL